MLIIVWGSNGTESGILCRFLSWGGGLQTLYDKARPGSVELGSEGEWASSHLRRGCGSMLILGT
jgi:hypothetical protein